MSKKEYYTKEEVYKKVGFTDRDREDIRKGAQNIILKMKLQEARKKKGMSQEELAVKSKIPRTTISRIENGFRNTTIKMLDRIANAMDLELEVRLVKKHS